MSKVCEKKEVDEMTTSGGGGGVQKLPNSEPEFTLEKLNTLIKSQLRLFFIPANKENAAAPADNAAMTENGGDLVVKSPGREARRWGKRGPIIQRNGSNLSPPPENGGSNLPPPETRHHSHRRRGPFNWSGLFEMMICDFILTCFLPLFFAPMFLLNIIGRFLARIYLYFKTGGKVRLMRGQDAFWASESEFNPCNFTSLYVIEGVPDLEKIRQRLKSSWIERKDTQGRAMFTKLKLKAVQRANYFGWEYHSQFDLSEHIRYLHPDNPDKHTGEAELFEEITAIYDRILPADKPQWEVLVVPNYHYEDDTSGRKGSHHYALIFRVHHSIMDGLSAAQGLRLVFADNVVEAGVDPMKPIRATLKQRMSVNMAALMLVGPYLLRNLYMKKETNPFHGPSLCGPKTLGWSRPIQLSAIKKLKDATQSSITAVFTACIGGAFKTLAEAKGHPPPEKLTAATCAALIPYPNIKAQNRFCVLFTPIHTQVEDALERVTLSQEPFANRFLNSAEVIMSYWITWIGGCLPVPVLKLLQDRICNGTVLLSNLPGPRSTAQIFGGDPIIDVVGWSPIRNKIGIGLCLFGYNGRIRANVVADASVFPDEGDVTHFISAFEGELASLGRTCLGLRDEEVFTCGNRHPHHSQAGYYKNYYKNKGIGGGGGHGSTIVNKRVTSDSNQNFSRRTNNFSRQRVRTSSIS
ncbi:uncharacterized protein LOC110844958 [Folsomia candida]|uniref:O-acyltransferase WSD n=1 Tax=Folsomia candida TaxID=158441 RepID=A0A226ET80_FOLCA|nr:uncharacterized protein LOC110844958 [Folsomia candida]OXA60729.1 O-acyltransferase WSD [Folsomia candida]